MSDKNNAISKIKTKVREKVHEVQEKRNSASGNRHGAMTKGRLELLVTIVPRSKSEYYLDFLYGFGTNMQLVLPGWGTADAKMAQLFGLADSEKAVILSAIEESKTPEALSGLEEKFTKIKNGKGIAYTIPIDSIIGALIFGFLSDNRSLSGK